MEASIEILKVSRSQVMFENTGVPSGSFWGYETRSCESKTETFEIMRQNKSFPLLNCCVMYFVITMES